MNTVSLFENDSTAEKTMTVKEVACILGVTERTVQRHLKAIRESLDNVVEVKNGVQTFITEAEVTLIKKKIETSGRSDIIVPSTLPKTNLEKQLLIRQAMQLQNEMIAELEAENGQLKIENAEAKPKAEYYDTLIERGNSTNLRNTAKELGIPEKQFIEQLQLDRFLYRDKHNQLCPYAEYVQKGYFEMKEWQHGQKSGIQTLITVTGKQYFIGKYKKAA
ncbi:HTH domain-containing protein [Treponema vincentii]|uniref:phage antirepressor KilAC domain-containing protein n=1 Tax=Treponema vincentii TaxID=69710 RepID=UPI001BB09AC7|nr:phage antirepressor KilAC domain-containing protein [Treponema vincentii]QUY18350.1 HTH domain-containing protein [Treponema vincentii]